MLPWLRKKIKIDDKEFIIAQARKRDVKAIQNLYNEVYRGKYTVPEIIDPKIMENIMYDEKYLWILAIHEKRICASYIFALDLEKLIGKLYGAIVHPDFRGKDLIEKMIITARGHLKKHGISLATVYATFRTVSLAPQKILFDLGFKTLGIFPNVHRIDEEETHGLRAWFSKRVWGIRKKIPCLISEMLPIYEVIQELLNLEDAIICDKEVKHNLKFKILHQGEKVNQEYKKLKENQELVLDFFPFHEPNYCIENKEEKVKVFIYVEEKDGHACIVGIQCPELNELKRILKGLIEIVASLRINYIELMVSAYNPKQQKAVVDAGFLPCAYYPAFNLQNGERLDYIVCTYSNEELNFSHVKLFETDRMFIDAYLRNTKYKNILPQLSGSSKRYFKQKKQKKEVKSPADKSSHLSLLKKGKNGELK